MTSILVTISRIVNSNAIIKKTKSFLSNFPCIYEIYTSTVEHLEKEKDHPSLIISEIIDSQKSSYLNV